MSEPHSPLYSQFAGDPEMAELVELFVSELPARVQSVTQAWEQRELTTLSTLAHQLKGACAGYGFPTIGTAAANVEGLLKSGEPLDRIASEVAELVDLCRRAMSPHSANNGSAGGESQA